MRVRPVVLPRDRPAILAFLDQAIAKGAHGLSENKHALIDLVDGRPGTGIVAEFDGQTRGYAGLAPASEPGEWAMELVTERLDIQELAQLVESGVAAAVEAGAHRLRWWTYDPASHTLPLRFGFEHERDLLLMDRRLPAGSAPHFDSRTRVTGFTVGTDEEMWLAVNNAAFAGHPENSQLTREDLQRRISMEWFDPAGLRMAWWDGDLAGFCWTKIHADRAGEIYIIGVAPRFQGVGLGKALVLEGMRHLSEAGCGRVFLYTEGDNTKAVELYERLGMTVERIHKSFIKAVA